MEQYNASTLFLDANLAAGRGDKTAIICGDQQMSYAQLAAKSHQTGNALKRLGVRMEERVMLLLLDSPEFVASFLGAIRMGAVPIPTNTLLRSADYEYLLNDSRAATLIVSEPLYAAIEPIRANLKFLQQIIVVGKAPEGMLNYAEWIAPESTELAPADTGRDAPCFWLYSSGTTGFPKGAVHLQHDMEYCIRHYGKTILSISEHDRTFSVAKLFFAYGLGNGLYFPLAVGATTILHSGPPTPPAVYEVITRHQPTLFFSVPTSYGALLALPEAETKYSLKSVRLCVSAGESLPQALFDRWREKWGVDILDGIGSTEVAHIFLSNRPGAIKPGSSGQVVEGYEAKIVDEFDQLVPQGETGNLLIKGDSTCAFYWNKHQKSKETIVGEWIRTGDKYLVDEDGYYWYQGRSDDMLKAGGIWVSPVEVEAALIAHPAVLECAVVGKADKDDLIKPKAFVVLKSDQTASDELVEELRTFVKNRIAHYKNPRWIEFVEQLPKTATGKIQRYKLRSEE